MSKTKNISSVTIMHYSKLVFRSMLFVWAFFTYVFNEKYHHMDFKSMAASYYPLLVMVFAVFFVEIFFRFFPSDLESPGCQKVFKKNYLPIENAPKPKHVFLNKGVLLVAISWIALNGAIYFVYYKGWITDGILLLISLAYSVSDMICILFFCPFQTWMMHNHCCTKCRIYNWDFLMMFTPMLFIRTAYTWSLFGMGLILFLRWEIGVLVTPERFTDKCNDGLNCENCSEKLCIHKKQLRSVWKYNADKIKKLQQKNQH